ncbi:hypothetical protein FO519_004417 [Halicephalobus sp. NKZ332]|nr:hypothetical protein FO519_004417 [Halicephalobus sp. NKZ332]
MEMTLSCTSCQIENLDLTVPGDGFVMPTTPGGVQMSGGCNVLTVTCTAVNTANVALGLNSLSYLPMTNFMPTVSVMLTCDATGNWIFLESGVTTTVTNVQCAEVA